MMSSKKEEKFEEYDPVFWEKTAMKYKAEAEYYQKELTAAHTLLGRVIHQASERWDRINIGKYFPTDNLHGLRTVGNPTGEKQTTKPKDNED